MKKQTAVEWFSDNAWKLTSKLISKEITLGRYAVLYFELHNQAKEMEKEQITNSYVTGHIDPLIMKNYKGLSVDEIRFEITKQATEYYNETYKNKTE
tara:strand:+ start:73 stop:363 length:291 start_codon:yes stop_codon:yes gene_type:complete